MIYVCMATLKDMLVTLSEDVESYLTKNPSVLMISASMFPQKWIFRTERGSLTVTVNTTGQARVREGEAAKPDVVIEGSHDLLSSLLQSKSTNYGVPKVEAFTKKGRFGYGIIRGRIGLK